ncbi:MAG: ABC transporter permease [Planctomycetaceae bacterium]|nr:ABC transporter permease [Planctomycetaceae bacterium]
MLAFAFRNLLSRPLRSLLALLGLTVAIAGMVGLFSVAGGIDAMVSDTFARIPGVVVMQYGAPIPLFSRIPSSFAEEVKKVAGVAVVNPEIWARANIIEGKRIVAPPRFLLGTDIESRRRLRHGVYRESIIEGRYLTLADRGAPSAVVSRQIAEEFDKTLGETLEVNGTPLEIVGIYYCGSLLLDVTIVVDIDLLQRMLSYDRNTYSCLYVEPDEETSSSEVAERIETVLEHHEMDSWTPSTAQTPVLEGSGNPLADFLRGLDARMKSVGPKTDASGKPRTGVPSVAADSQADTPPVEVRRAEDWGERFDEFSADLNIFLSIMTAIGVTIAVLSIVNTMLMSVTERIVEFGILKANGWSQTDIMKLIGFESALLGLSGGVLGALIGWVGTHVVNWAWPEHVQLKAGVGLLLFGVVFATALGILGGLYPAVWATRMRPMDAIRRG